MRSTMKIKIQKACTDYLCDEIKQLRDTARVTEAENAVMKNFFHMVDNLTKSGGRGFSEDFFITAQKEIEEATTEAKLFEPVKSPPPSDR